MAFKEMGYVQFLDDIDDFTAEIFAMISREIGKARSERAKRK